MDDLPTVSSFDGEQARRGGDGPRLAPGEPWGSYRIGRLLGRGGMGEVYEAEHLASGRRVALKVLRTRLHSGDDRARFLREGQLAASVSHPHTVYIFGSEEISGMPVISMELLPGGTLKDLVTAEGPLRPPDAVAAVLDIIGGLDAAHAAGILHRDIKPSNCFVDTDGTVKVGDFGLSISTLARDVHQQLATAGFEGTPQFAPPEQLRGEPLDVRADIYAVGATLYYLLTGRPPFDAADLRALVALVTTEPPKSPRLIRPEIPARLAAVVLQCLAKTPAERPASYAALADALRPFLPVEDAPARLGVRTVAGIADVAILALPITVWMMWSTDPLTRTPAMTASATTWTSLLSFVYYLGFEGLWGASLGKRLFGLRVASTASAPASFLRVAFRTTAYLALPTLTVLLPLFADVVAIETFNTIRTPVALLLAAAMFSTARRHNGWAALHDLVSGTRIVARPAAQARRLRPSHAASTVAAAVSTSLERRYGPYTVVADAAESGDERLVVGFDPVLRRQVWIHVVAPSTPAVSATRRDVSRIGRLHWLTGRRSTGENWDAYEAPDGGPLLMQRAAPPEWPQVKLWLLDAANELTAAVSDGSMPVLRLDRLWLRNDGHLVLLDFPGPQAAAMANGGADGPDLTPVGLLSALATRTLPLAGTTSGPAVMPLSARTMIERWSGPVPPALADARAAIVAVAAAQDRVRPARRAVPIALASAPTLVLMLAALLILPSMVRFVSNPETGELLSALSALASPNPPPGSFLADPENRAAAERYLAGRYRDVLSDERFWSMTIMQGPMRNLRPVAADLLRRHPSVSAEELARVSDAIAPVRARWQRGARQTRSGFASVGGIIISTMTALALGLVLAASMLSAVLLPGGVMMRPLGFAVVARDGRQIGRMRSLIRAVVAWLPAIVWMAYLASAPKVQGFVPAPPSPLLGMGLTVTVLAIGVVWTIAQPARGPHDRLLGTWVVPR